MAHDIALKRGETSFVVLDLRGQKESTLEEIRPVKSRATQCRLVTDKPGYTLIFNLHSSLFFKFRHWKCCDWSAVVDGSILNES